MPHSSWSIDLLLIRDLTRVRLKDVVHDRVVLRGVARPMNVRSELRCVGFRTVRDIGQGA